MDMGNIVMKRMKITSTNFETKIQIKEENQKQKLEFLKRQGLGGQLQLLYIENP